jgi:hypothetical protein
MKIKYSFIAFLVILILIISNGDNLYAQETGDTADTEEEGTDNFEPNDDELASLITVQQNPNAIVGPLIQTKWGQGVPYNNLFPMVSGQRKLTGCGNTARAQIMAYHRHPAQGRGQSTVVSPGNITVPLVNFNVAYDWDNMLNTYRRDGRDSNERQRNAVAILNYHIAAARSSTEGNKFEAMVTVFGYDRSIQQLDRRFYTDAEWETIIKQQLDLRLPVYYWGRNPGNHAFIVDGYDSTGRFHINWGWRGSGDGWYHLNNFNPRGERRYSNTHTIAINIKPNAGGVSAGYEMALTAFRTEQTSVSQNEPFRVTTRIRNNRDRKSVV